MSAKSILKKTREAIDAKDYATALKLSKSLLADDKSNYVALVYAALSSLELGSKEDAERFYEKAIENSPTNILAWQGLGNCYDKQVESGDEDVNLIKKLLKVYCKLTELDSDETKILKIVNKIGKLPLNVALDEIVQVLNDLLSRDNLSQQIKIRIKQILLNNLSKNNENEDLNEKYFDVYETCYLNLDKDLLTKDNHVTYMKLLYSKQKVNELLENNSLTQLLEDLKHDSIFLNWICKVFNELSLVANSNFNVLLEKFQDWNELLGKSVNENAQLAKIIVDLNANGGITLEIKDRLVKLTSESPKFLYGWIYLSEVYLFLQFEQDAIKSSIIAKKLIKSEDIKLIHRKIDQLIVFSHCKSFNDDQLREAIQIGEKILNDDRQNPKIISCLIEAHLKLNNVIAAKTLLEKLQTESKEYSIAKALILQESGEMQHAIEVLDTNIQDSTEYWLLLGDLYWSVNYTKSLTAYLKATKSHPSSFICYQRLGHYYQKVGDLDKSKRCYEKSIKINCTKIACVELSKIYRKLQKWDENLSLLLSLTCVNITIENSWAFFQLGIHYYEREDFLPAMNILRLVTRIEPNNCFCWECLGDCYISGGSYTSALKCYEKVKTINPKSLYPILQIANIKKLIGEYTDAKTEFKYVLQMDPKYIPALKGVAETSFLMAKQYFHKQLYGLSRDALQDSLNLITRALHIDADLSCCWKIAADCCYMVSLLPFKYSFLSVLDIISESSEHNDESVMIVDELLELAITIYCKALSYSPDNIYIYHDLACCYLQYSKLSMVRNVHIWFLNHALTIIQHCINSNSNYARHWNVLGNIFYEFETKKIELAQHAFIKAVTLDRNNAISWTNLGTLYLHLNELKLANEVFSQAQKTNPNYVNCWIGQALIAEASDMEESMDLFRHTMELAFHPEGTVGYAHWVCKTLMGKRKDETIYAIDNMHAIPVACDGLRWYVENNPRDACAWNMLGILSEHLGLLPDARVAYEKSIKYSQKSEAFTNLCRTLTTSKLYVEAIKCIKSIPDRNVNSEIAYALALFKEQDYESAYNVYTNVLEMKTESQHIQSDLLVALASMIYMFQGPNEAKDLLFQSTQLKMRSPWSLYAVLSLGLLEDDVNLAKLAFEEIEKLPVNEENLKHYANLLVYTFYIQGDYKTAISKLSSLIHLYPNSPSLWLQLSTLLYRIRGEVKPTSNNSDVIAKCAQASLKLKGNNPNLSMVLPIVTATSILSGDLHNALKAAERLVHYYPDNQNAGETLQFTLTRLKTCTN